MTKRNSWASGEAEYDDVAIPYADEPGNSFSNSTIGRERER